MNTQVPPVDSMRIEEDLNKSGLVVADLNARLLGPSEKAATNTSFQIQGYVIPYYTIEGKPASFYRVRLFDHDPKYKQLKDSPNHVYFPKNFAKLAKDSPYIIATEGEKKAALLCKLGFAACAFGGVDSWRNRQISIPVGSELAQSTTKITAKLPAGEEVSENYMSSLALGMQDLMDLVLRNSKQIVIVYDTDDALGCGTEVQSAAARFGFEMRFRGIRFDHIRQLVLPNLSLKDGKTGIDDYLMHPAAGPKAFAELLRICLEKPSAFPRHPNIRDFLNKRLQKTKMMRKETQSVAIAVLSELDGNGVRIRSDKGAQSFYFEKTTHQLIKGVFRGQPNDLTDSPFGQYMYQKYGIGAADSKIMQWIGTLFTGEQPIAEVQPHRVIARQNFNDDNCILQLSDGEFAIIDANGVEFCMNGDKGIMFEAGHIKGCDAKLLRAEFEKQNKDPQLFSWWFKILNEVRLKDKNRKRTLTAMLYYIAPFLYRWRGTQLPIEMTLGEAGSGKSTLQELRLQILVGDAKLRNSPKDLPGWNASVSNSGGMHIIDNVQLLNKDLRQMMSDEICRLITEPDPTIEMRKYYTESDLIRLPVRCVFGITSIVQPFQNADILQRSFIIELEKPNVEGEDVMYDMAWQKRKIDEFGGREAWLAHHLVVLHRFFKLVQEKWDPQYKAKNRLVNFEQALMLMMSLFKMENSWVPDYLIGSTEQAVTENDWVFEGLVDFNRYWLTHATGAYFTVTEISQWAEGMPEYEKCEVLTNTRRLGKFMKAHKSMVSSIAGIWDAGMTNNRARFKVVPIKRTV